MKTIPISVLTVLLACTAFGQEHGQDSHFNFNIGGGIGFPLSDTGNFVNNGANFVVGGGPNVNHVIGFSGEFMWHDLPLKSSVIRQLGIPGANSRQYSLTGNLILRLPTHGEFGAYFIGGGGWYRRNEQALAPTIVAGTVCSPFWSWWGACTTGLFPANVVIGSRTSDALGGNVGGGVTFHVAENFKFYAEVRYHHASYGRGSTDILPLTFGFRW